MKLPHSVSEVLRDHIVLESEGIDRLYLNVYVPQLQRVDGVVWYLRGHLADSKASMRQFHATEAAVNSWCDDVHIVA